MNAGEATFDRPADLSKREVKPVIRPSKETK